MCDYHNNGMIWTTALILYVVYRSSESNRQDFSEVTKSKWFVDKTRFISDFLEKNRHSEPNVKVITGPKGWGKSTIVDMTRRFLQVQVYTAKGKPVDRDNNSNYPLFCQKPLDVCKHNVRLVRKQFGQRPVVYISFLPLKNVTDSKSFSRAINEILQNSYSKHGYFLNENVTPPLYSLTKQAFRKIMVRKIPMDETKYFPRLAEILHSYFGLKAVILLDDYDALRCRESFKNATDYEQTIKSLNLLILSLFKLNTHFSDALITGERCVKDANLLSSLKDFTEYRFVGQNYSSRYRGFVQTINLNMTGHYQHNHRTEAAGKWQWHQPTSLKHF